MAGPNATNGDVAVGGMLWEVTHATDLDSSVQTLRMNCVEVFPGPDGQQYDQTTVALLEDGSIRLFFADKASDHDKARYAAHTFAPGVLRAIVDYVEPTAAVNQQAVRAPRQGWLSKLLPW